MEEEAHLANTFLELHPPTLDTSIENIIHLYITILNEKVGPFEEWYGATSAPFTHGFIDLFNMMWHFFLVIKRSLTILLFVHSPNLCREHHAWWMLFCGFWCCFVLFLVFSSLFYGGHLCRLGGELGSYLYSREL